MSGNLRGIQHREDRPWVIPGLKRGAHLAFLHGPWRLILERAGIGNQRIHDLRHSFASGGLLVGEGAPMIGKLLGHNRVQELQPRGGAAVLILDLVVILAAIER